MSKGTARHSVRVDDDLWSAALAKAERTGVAISDVVRKRLEDWVTAPDETTKKEHRP